jgi:hypothetical protein
MRFSKNRFLTDANRFRAYIVAVIATALSGCGRAAEELPTTFPVTGTVVNKVGKPLNDGRIEFVSTIDPKTQAIGKLQPDGSFTLLTAIGKEVLPGAIEGPHKVTLLPGSQTQEPIYFTDTCTVKSGQNHFKLVTGN